VATRGIKKNHMARKLCWVTHRDPRNPNAGGAERSVYEVCLGLSKLGWEVSVVSGGYPDCLSVEMVGPTRIVRGTSPIAMHLELPRLFRRVGRFDIVIEDLGHVVPFLAERVVSEPGVVLFRHLHRRTLPGQVSGGRRLILETIERSYPLIYRRWPFVAPSQGAALDLASLGISQTRIHRIGYGVDASLFKPGTLTESPTLIYFAGLRSYKRPSHAIHVLRILRQQGIVARLTVVGVGPELSNLMELSRSLGLSDQVTFAGRVSDDELSMVISRSWVHLQCAVAEGWGLTVGEAAASGVPTVAYRVPGLIDSVSEGENGILVPDGNLLEFANAVALIIRNRQIWTSKCRDSVARMSWTDVSQDWNDFLLQL